MNKLFQLLILIFMSISSQNVIGQELMKVFYLNQNGEFKQMTPAKGEGLKQKKNTFGRLMVGNLAKQSLVVNYDGITANYSVHPDNAIFYVILPENSTYSEINLGKLKKSKGHRELTLMSGNGFGQSKSKYEDVTLQKLSSHVYVLRINAGYKDGEYAICQVQNGFPLIAYDFYLSSSYPSIYMELPSADVAVNKLMEIQNPNLQKNEEMFNNVVLLSDVDKNIPKTNDINENSFGLIISNEDYLRVEGVPFAKHDGVIVKDYMMNTLGLPEKNIDHVENATLNDIKYSLKRLQDISDAYNGEANFIIYYSGHGVPGEKDGNAYLLPIDGYGSDPSTAYSLDELYELLGSLNSKSVILVMDACFSGAARTGEMLASSRGIKVKSKSSIPTGNLIVLSACQSDETAHPYTENSHGLLTYYFLKKLQDSKGNASISDIAKYVISEVKKTSIIENNSPQTPMLYISDNISSGWQNIKLK